VIRDRNVTGVQTCALPIFDGKGSPTSWLAGMNQALALKPDGIALFADVASLQYPIKVGVAQGIKFVGLHAAGTPGPQPNINLFRSEERRVGKGVYSSRFML